MNKQDFLARLRKKLAGLPRQDVEERLSFYSEMIDDRMEEGLSEEEAVATIEMDEPKPVEHPKRKMKTWEIVLLVLGAPVWLSLLIAAAATILSLYVSLWAVVISLWATGFAMLVSSAAVAVFGIVFAVCGQLLPGLAIASGSLVCAGLSFFLLFGCHWATKGSVMLTKKGFRACFAKKENTK